MNIAENILDQLGGRRFIEVTGAGCLANYGAAVSFTLPRHAARWGINHVKVSRNAIGLYDIDFGNVADGVYRVIRSEADIKGGRLLTTFSRVTGLTTHL